MRDGVRLCATLFRPVAVGKHPTLLLRTPYRKPDNETLRIRTFVEHGYAVLVQDVRGRFDSEGIYTGVEDDPADAADTLDWLVRQPWCNDSVGMFGGSYLGITQWRAAITGHPALKAIVPIFSGSDEYLDRFYSPGGAFKLGHRLLWFGENFRRPGHPLPPFEQLVRFKPVESADILIAGHKVEPLRRALAHPHYDAYWKSLSTQAKLDRVKAAVFSIGGWYDNYVESDLNAFAALHRRGHPARLIVGPWGHNLTRPFEKHDAGAAGRINLQSLELGWFETWLRNSHEATPIIVNPLRIFVMGTNEWRDEERWPLERAVSTPFYLSSGAKSARSLDGDGTLSERPPLQSGRRARPDTFEYDPAQPVMTLGGNVCCNPQLFPWGPLDQRSVESRPDVLVYTSEPLKRDVEVTGPISVVLWVSSDAPDTDFTAKLVDVEPDGYARILCDGILRMRSRFSIEMPTPYKPGTVEKIVIPAGVTSNVFLAGHRIRVDISSSNFPRFDRNPNTGELPSKAIRFRKANQKVFHERTRPSHVLLPVVPRS